jgi:hypothetical protein
MTLILPEQLCCAVCGTESEHLIMQSTNSFGSPDLDTRPAPMMRHTMAEWTLRCPSCGYAAKDITEAVEGAAEVVRSDEYQALLQDEAMPELARTFMAESYLQEQLGGLRNAVWAAIHAAWVLDDEGDVVRTATARNEALRLIDGAITEGVSYAPDKTSELAIRVDLLRRARRYEEAEGLLDLPVEAGNNVLQAVLAFEQHLVRQRDAGCYMVLDALDFTDELPHML